MPTFRLLFALGAILLSACSSPPSLLGIPTDSDDGSRYSWSERSGEWELLALDQEGDAVEALDSGRFDQVLGPVPTKGGIAWARSLDGEWRVIQTGVGELDMRRGQSVSDALAAAWALERVQAGLVPGNAADLASLAPAARRGAWPRAD